MTNASKRHGARFRARRRAVDVLYEAETRDIDPVAIVEERIELARDPQTGVAPVADYTRIIIEGVAVELDRVDEVVGGHLAEDWALDRLVPVDRAILRVAVWEMLFNEEVPLKTAVAEAVEIAAQLSTDPAPAYVNSVLDAILHKIDELRAESQEEGSDAADGELPSQDLSFDEALAHAEQALEEGDLAGTDAPAEHTGEVSATQPEGEESETPEDSDGQVEPAGTEQPTGHSATVPQEPPGETAAPSETEQADAPEVAPAQEAASEAESTEHSPEDTPVGE